MQGMRTTQDVGSENVWFANNVNERQRLLNTMTRGRFDKVAGDFEQLRSPDYFMIWIMHQLLYGLASQDAYTGWSCGVKCHACDLDHGGLVHVETVERLWFPHL